MIPMSNFDNLIFSLINVLDINKIRPPAMSSQLERYEQGAQQSSVSYLHGDR